MAITIAEALPIRASIVRRIRELSHELNQVSTITHQKGEAYELPARTVEQVLAEWRAVSEQQALLDTLVQKANQEHTIEWDGGPITIAVAIERAKAMRVEIGVLKSLGGRRKESISQSYTNQAVLVERTTYDPEEYRKLAMQLERRVTKLSSLIDRNNMDVEIEFDADEYFGV